jgi:hypothetical protein
MPGFATCLIREHAEQRQSPAWYCVRQRLQASCAALLFHRGTFLTLFPAFMDPFTKHFLFQLLAILAVTCRQIFLVSS